MGPVGPVGPSLSVGTIETNMGPAAPGTVGPQGLPGPKGDPGGFILGTALSNTTNLNDVVTPGIYRQGSAVPASMNYPSTDLGVLLVHQASVNPWVLQEYTPFSSTTTGRATHFYRREYIGNVWYPWRAYTSTRVDQSAGRAIYAWDDVNNREQMIYGDTGWRAIALDPTIGVDAVGSFFASANGAALVADSVKIRRIGNRVFIGGNGLLQPKQDYSTSTRNVVAIPNGFRSNGANDFIITRYGNNGGDSGQRLIMLTIPADYAPALTPIQAVPLIDSNWNGLATGTGWPKTYGGIWIYGSWVTNETWPTSLPGTANGTIPNL
jgi:hypothetical protein